MWYSLADSNKQYPLTIDRVKKIKSLNQQGSTPDELGQVEVTSDKPKEAAPEFVELVGQISLRSLERTDKKRQQQHKRHKAQGSRHKGQRGQQQKGQQQNNPNRNQGNQSGSQRPNPPDKKGNNPNPKRDK